VAVLSRAVPELSVVVPNYNHARYLESALRAHLEQTRPPLEVIVVDDASTDDSVAIVERLARDHPRLRLIRLAKNGGVNAAINRGLREARGDYVCFSAADDLVTADFAARSMETLARYPAAAFCFFDPARRVGDAGRLEPCPMYMSDGPCFVPPISLRQLLKRGWFGLPGFVVYRRDAIVAVGGFVEDLDSWADNFANCVLGFRHGAAYVPEVLTVFRVLPDSYSAMCGRQTQLHRALTYRVVDLLRSPRFGDVASSFRECALLPYHRVEVLAWLFASAPRRHYLTLRLVVRAAVRRTWKVAKPYVPSWFRPPLRRVAVRWAQLWTAE
jgi:glycosyltransferase involved in cell wall biosynthesis